MVYFSVSIIPFLTRNHFAVLDILLLLPAHELLPPLTTILTMGDVAIHEVNHLSHRTAPHCQGAYIISPLLMCLLIASRQTQASA
jgi:hypothetical protein